MGIGSTPKKKNKAPLMSVQSRKLRFVVKPKKKTTKDITCFRNTSVSWCGELNCYS